MSMDSPLRVFWNGSDRKEATVGAVIDRAYSGFFSYAGAVSGSPFFAKINARNLAGLAWLAFFDTSCVLPGYS